MMKDKRISFCIMKLGFVERILVAYLIWVKFSAVASVEILENESPCPPSIGTTSPSRYDPLACWLWKLQLSIPDQTFRKSFLSLGIQGMTCSGFTVGSIVSSYIPSSNNTSNYPSLDILVLGVAATCQGKYRATPGLSGNVQAHVDSDAALQQEQQDSIPIHSSSDQPPLHLVWSLLSNTSSSSTTARFDWPVTLNTTTCDIHLVVPSRGGIHFSGSISAQMINWFSGTIAKYVSDALATQLCPLLISNVDPTLSHLLQQAQVYLNGIIVDNTTTTQSNNDDKKKNKTKRTGRMPWQQHEAEQVARLGTTSRKTVNPSNVSNSSLWLNFTADTPVLTSTLTLLNDILLKRYLHEGILLHWWNQHQFGSHRHCQQTASCGWLFGGVNSLLKSIFTSFLASEGSQNQEQQEWNRGNIEETVSLCVRVPPETNNSHPGPWFLPARNITFLIPRYGKVLLEIKRFCIDGLDQMDAVQLFRPIMTPYQDGNSSKTKLMTTFDTNLITRHGWNFTTTLRVTVQSIPGGIVQGPDLEEEFHLHVNISRGQIGTTSGNDNKSKTTGGGLMLQIQRDLFRQLITVGLLEDAFNSIFRSIILGGDRRSVHDKNLWPCFLAPLESIHFPSLFANLTVDRISFVPVDNVNNFTHQQAARSRFIQGSDWVGGESLEEDVDDLLNHVLQLFLTEYADTVTAALAGLTAGQLRELVNSLLDKSLQQWKQPITDSKLPFRTGSDTILAACNGTFTNATSTSADINFESLTSPSMKHLMNWTHVHWLESINTWLQRYKTIWGINEYLNCVSSFITDNILPVGNIDLGSIFATFDPLSPDSSNGLTLRVKNARLSHIGSLDRIEFMAPVSHLDGVLESGLDYATRHNESAWSVERSPQVTAEVELLFPALANLSSKINLTLFVGDVHLNGSVSLLYDHDRLRSMMLSNVLMEGQCALSVPTSEFRIPDATARIGMLGLNLSALVTTSNTPTGDPVQINLHFEDLPTTAMSSIINWFLSTIRDWVNESSDGVLASSQSVCNSTEEVVPVSPDDDINHFASHWILLGIGVLFVILQPAVILLVKNRRSRVVNPNSSELNLSRELSEPLLCPLEELEGTKTESLEESGDIEDNASSSLMMSSSVPDIIRVLLPMFIVGTVALLLSSNLSVGASVNLILSLSGQNAKEVQLPSLFAFSLGNTVREMYHAGIYPLLFLVLVFSGIWPYLKLVLMLLAWVTPIPKQATFRRKQLLLALDALGKFSLVDTYVLVLMMVAFRYHLQLTEKMALDVFVMPTYGFYGFLIATCASLVAGHAMIFFHRQDELYSTPTSLAEVTAAIRVKGRREAVMQHEFHVHETADDGTIVLRRKKLRRWTQALLLVMILTTIILLKIGVTRKSFVFEFGGLAGMALGDDSKRHMSYSLVSLGAAIPSSVPVDYGAAIRWLQVAYYFYALVTPFVCLVSLTVLWAWPMSLHDQYGAVMLAEISNAWSAIEVFVLSIVAALLEISTFCSFIIGHKCDLINNFVEKYFDQVMPNGEDSTCYSVQARVQSDCWYLVVGAVLNSFLVSNMLRFAHCALDDCRQRRQESVENGPQQLGNAQQPAVVHDKVTTMVGRLSSCPFSNWIFTTTTMATTTATTTTTTDNVLGSEGEPNDEVQVPDGETQKYWARWREVCSVT